MSPQDLADQFNLYARSNDNAYDEAMGDAEPGTELHRMRAVYFKWHTERAHAYRHAAEMVRDSLVPRWSRTLPTTPGHYWVRLRQGEFETVARVYQRKDELVVWTVAGGSAGTPVTAYSGWEWSRAVPEPEEPSP